jgi:hypothetical protein
MFQVWGKLQQILAYGVAGWVGFVRMGSDFKV